MHLYAVRVLPVHAGRNSETPDEAETGQARCYWLESFDLELFQLPELCQLAADL